MILDTCPTCGSDEIRTVLADGRLNKQQCRCGWRSKPFEPEWREITGEANYFPICGSRWHYEIKDKYGAPYVASRAYGTREEAKDEMLRDLTSVYEAAGAPYTGILFPPNVVVQGEIFTL